MSMDTTHTTDNMPDEERAKRTKNIWKNVIMISFSFLMVFNAYQGLSRLQSSLHRVEGMGTICQAVLYGTLVLSCMFLPKLIISFIGHKWTIAISFIGYILYMAANGYAVWATMITASILVGICAAPLWTAQCSYFTKISGEYARLTGGSEKDIGSRFFGIFFMFFQMSSITGSIISATALKPVPVNGSSTEPLPDEQVMAVCGAEYCPWGNYSSTNMEELSESAVWMMVVVYIAIAIVGVLLVCFTVDQLPLHLRDDPKQARREIPSLAVATFRQLALPAQLLLIPLTCYSGFEQAYYNAEFTQSFVSCSLGIWKVGLVTLPYGCVNALVSLTSGQLIKYTGRTPFFVAAGVVDLCTQLTLLLWAPRPSQEYVLYILAGMWGFSDGVWQTQINALYGELFATTSEAAFSNYRMWESVGFIIAFAYSSFLCTDVKTYILTSVLILGLSGYFIVNRKYKSLPEEEIPKVNNVDSIGGVVNIDNEGFDNKGGDWLDDMTQF